MPHIPRRAYCKSLPDATCRERDAHTQILALRANYPFRLENRERQTVQFEPFSVELDGLMNEGENHFFSLARSDASCRIGDVRTKEHSSRPVACRRSTALSCAWLSQLNAKLQAVDTCVSRS